MPSVFSRNDAGSEWDSKKPHDVTDSTANGKKILQAVVELGVSGYIQMVQRTSIIVFVSATGPDEYIYLHPTQIN